MARKPDWFYRQSGTIPFRVRDGEIEVLLVTSKSAGRWIIPKGIVEPDLTAAESAAQEAYEEAGVRGELSEAIGEFQVEKWGGVCTVSVFALRVTEILDRWPEEDVRERRWVGVQEACELVEHDGMEAVLTRLPEVVGHEPT